MKSEQDHDWLFLAGIGNSGNSHWQRHWQAGQNNCLWALELAVRGLVTQR